MHSRAVIAAALLLGACGLRSAPDGGGAGGGAAGGAAGGSAGGAAGGSQLLAVRVADAGLFTLRDVSPAGGATALSGNGALVVLGNALGQVQRFDGGAWATLLDVAPTPVAGVYVSPANRIFAAAGDRLFRCLASCDQASSWKVETVLGRTFDAVCGQGALVYAVGHETGSLLGVAYARDNLSDTWAALIASTHVADEYRDCAASTDGRLYIAAYRYIVEVDLLGGPTTKADLGGVAWTSVALSGDEVVAAGARKSLARRDAAGGWSVVSQAPLGDSTSRWLAVAAVDGGVFAGGERGSTAALAWVDDTALTLLPDLRDVEVQNLFAADDRTLFIAGVRDGGAAVVYRATR